MGKVCRLPRPLLLGMSCGMCAPASVDLSCDTDQHNTKRWSYQMLNHLQLWKDLQLNHKSGIYTYIIRTSLWTDVHYLCNNMDYQTLWSLRCDYTYIMQTMIHSNNHNYHCNNVLPCRKLVLYSSPWGRTLLIKLGHLNDQNTPAGMNEITCPIEF